MDYLTDGNHLEMTVLHGTIELDESMTVAAHLEGLHVEAIPGVEVLVARNSLASYGAVDIGLLAGLLDIAVLLGGAIPGGGRHRARRLRNGGVFRHG